MKYILGQFCIYYMVARAIPARLCRFTQKTRRTLDTITATWARWSAYTGLYSFPRLEFSSCVLAVLKRTSQEAPPQKKVPPGRSEYW